MPLSQRHCVPFPRVVTSWGYQFPPRRACSRAPRPSRYPTVAAPTHRFSLPLHITGRERERKRESEEVALVYFLLSFYLLRTFSAYDPPLSPYRVPLPFALRGTLPSTHLPPACGPSIMLYLATLAALLSPFCSTFFPSKRRAPFPCSPPLFLSRRVALSVSLSRSAIFFSEKKFVPFSCFSTSLLLPLSLRSFASFSLFLPTVISLSSPLSANHPLVPFSFLIDVAGNL